MNAVGIIAEYNPFHNGHLYHLLESKKKAGADCAVAVISGSFTQRGEPAFLDKWTRAEIAVKNGVDLVIELPFIYACNNAEYFARGAVSLLDRLGAVTHLSFGSEHGELGDLMRAAEILAEETPEFKEAIRIHLSKGLSYPKARYEALLQCDHTLPAQILLSPNNILAVEYLKQWIRLKSAMKPITVKRIGTGYHDPLIKGNLASASAIRARLLAGGGFHEVWDCVPEATAEALRGLSREEIVTFADLFPLLMYRIRTLEKEQLALILSAGEGLENKLKKAAEKARTADEILRGVKSKRYTETRICRLLIHTLTGLKRDEFFSMTESGLLYARVLAFSEKGAFLLRAVKKKECSTIPVVTNINKEISRDDPVRTLLKYDILASDIWNLLRYGELYSHSDHVHKISVKLKI